MADRYGINLGNVLAVGDTIKTARNNRAVNELKARNDDEERSLARKNARMGQTMRQNILEGIPGAQGAYAVIDPDGHQQFMEILNNADDREREVIQQQVDMMGKIALTVRESENPAQAWATIIQKISGGEIPEGVDTTYDPAALDVAIARATEFDDMLEEFNRNPDIQRVTIGGEDQLYTDGQLTQTAQSQASVNQDFRERAEENARLAQGSGGNAPRGTERERIIQMLKDRGMDPVLAENYGYGIHRIELVPETGQIVQIDESDPLNPVVTEIPITGSQEAVPAPMQGMSLYELAPLATGVQSAASNFMSRVGGQFGMDVNEAVLNARSTIETANNALIRSLAVNPRFPAAEIARIEREIKMKPSWLNSPDALISDMVTLDRNLSQRAAQAERDANDPSLPPDARESQRTNAMHIRNFLAQLQAPQPLTQDQLTVQGIATVSDVDLNNFLSTATDEQLNALPPEVAEAIRSRFSAGPGQ